MRQAILAAKNHLWTAGTRNIVFRVVLCSMAATAWTAALDAGNGLRQGKSMGAQENREKAYISDYGHQKPVAVESRDWLVSLRKVLPCPDLSISHRCFEFALMNRISGGQGAFTVANITAQVNEIRIINSRRAAVLGRADPNLAVVTLVGLPGGNTLDSFLGFWPAFSPYARFVAYQKFFPAHPGYEWSLSAEYLVYDLTASPQDNRTPPNRARPLQAYDVGWPLYPEGVKNIPGDNMFEGHDLPVHWMASEGFFWLEKSDTVAFVDRWQGVNRLVVADLSSGVQRAKVSVHRIDTAGVLDFSACKTKVAPSDFEAWSKDPGTFITVTNIEASRENRHSLRLDFAPHPCLKAASLDVPTSP